MYKAIIPNFQAWLGIGDYAKELHEKGMSLILILDPAIQADSDAFNRSLQQVCGSSARVSYFMRLTFKLFTGRMLQDRR